MVKLFFTSFNDYEAKLQQYLENKNLSNAFQIGRLEGIKKMTDGLNMKIPTDVNQLAFLMWMLSSEYISLLHSGYLMKKINLGYFKNQLTKDPPCVKITGFAGFTPLGGSRASSSQTTAHYDCIKFIGQFTNDQKVYDQCLKILEGLPSKVDGPILNPPDVMYLMNYNQYVETSKNKFKVKTNDRLNKLRDFKGSIWQPDPSHEHQYDRYKINIQKAWDQIACEHALDEATQNVRYICLADWMIHSQCYVTTDTESLSGFHSKVDNNLVKKIEEILIDISSTLLDTESQLTDEKKKTIKEECNKNQIEAKIRFLDTNDFDEFSSIAIEAYVYVSDDAYEKETLKRDMLIAIYDRKLVEPDSKFSHNLMRNATEFGRLWLVKFLVEKGTPTKNLPKYGEWPWVLESKQLSDILNEKVTDYHGYGKEWVCKRTSNRERVKEYLKEHDLI